jgi:HNH endonuclease
MKPMAERLLEKIEKKPSGCWEWTRYIEKNGYAKINCRLGGKQVCRGAHRVSYATFVGPITDGKFVLHRCDNQRCINPDHLFLGTHAENMEDMCRKGRKPRGEQLPKTKLTAMQVQEIRCSTEGSLTLAPKYNVSSSLIRKIRQRALWSHIGENSHV